MCVYLFAPSRGQPFCFSLCIVFFLGMNVEVEVGVHDIRSRFTPRFSMKIIPFESQKTFTITLFADKIVFAFFGGGSPAFVHCLDCLFSGV